MDFNSFADQSTPTDFRDHPSAQLPYTHPDWTERPGRGDQRTSGSNFNPSFQPSRQRLSQPNSYDPSPPNLASVQQQQPIRLSFSGSNPGDVNADSSGLPGDPFAQPNEEYHRGGSGFPSQQRAMFNNQVLAQIPPPPALYHPGQPLDLPGPQVYHRQVLPLNDATAENGVLDLFCTSMQSRVPSQDGCVYRSLVRGMQC